MGSNIFDKILNTIGGIVLGIGILIALIPWILGGCWFIGALVYLCIQNAVYFRIDNENIIRLIIGSITVSIIIIVVMIIGIVYYILKKMKV